MQPRMRRTFTITYLPQPLAEPLVDGGVFGPDGAGFEAAGEEGSVGVADDAVELCAGADGVCFDACFGAFDGFVAGVAGGEICGKFVVADDEVFADDDTNVFYFKTLAGVDAADLVDGVGGDDPGGAV